MAVGRGPVAELAGEVHAPAVSIPRGRDPAGVTASGAERSEAHAPRHGHRTGTVGSRGPVADLTVVVEAPTVSDTCGCEPARVLPAAGRDRREAQATRYGQRHPANQDSVDVEI